MPTPAARGLTAAELALAVEDLRELCRAAVLDAAALLGTDDHDDVLLVLQEGEDQPKAFVHIALGSKRARITTTGRRFGRDARARGPGPDLLQRELQGATLRRIDAHQGERRCTLVFDAEHGERRLIVELFSARGLWVLCDAEGVAMTMSRAVTTAVRTLRRGDVYNPPPPAPTTTAASTPPPRFAPPALESIDRHFTELDLAREQTQAHEALGLALERGRKQARHKVQGMRTQLENIGRSQELRDTADLMLAYAHSVPRGACSMQVPSLDGTSEITIPLNAEKPVTVQANQLYDKARRLDDGREVTEQRLATALQDVAALDELANQLKTADESLRADIRDQLRTRGLLPKDQTKERGKPHQKKATEQTPFRRFTSLEGYAIFVGRNNNQNDELTMRFANGNDLWLHVGGGRPGSHVVIRLPKQKTASLETLLDAATLAVYYSKARGEQRIDVVYTFRKNVRKPKGLPPGAVIPSQTKTVTVTSDQQRLARVLASSGPSGD